MKLLIFALLFISNDIIASATYDSQDQLYVWARGGLNVRSGPGTSYEVVDKLSFGDSVEFILEKDISYNITAISKVDTNHYRYKVERPQPFIMHGWWQKVITAKGITGYAVSQYLMDLKPIVTHEFVDIPLELNKIDTLYKNPIISDGEGLNTTIRHTYTNNIVSIEESGGVWSSSNIIFPKMKFSDVLVIMDIAGDHMRVERNWKDELMLSDGFCHIRLTKKEEDVIYEISCSC